MRKLPPLAQLRAFEAAARHLSFKMAASELGVTPTAISHQIRLLELHCGCSLFQRRPRPLALTGEGTRLFPVIREGLDSFCDVLSAVRDAPAGLVLRISTTNAFAGRWLVPRLPKWREVHPGYSIEVIGTDRVLDMNSDECDFAIRWTTEPPRNLVARELFKSSFCPVCSPSLLPNGAPLEGYEQLKLHTIIHWYWSPLAANAPTWRWWLDEARANDPEVPHIDDLDQLTFQEELHAIDAVIAGQGIAICDNVLIENEIKSGRLVRAFSPAILTAGYYILYRSNHPHEGVIKDFYKWAKLA